MTQTVARQPRAARQRIRKGVILAIFLLFPVVMNFVSPYLIIDGSARGVITGSFLVFALMFASAIFLGRLWCAWVCPGAGLMEAAFMVNNRPAPGGRLNWIKWFIWVPWVTLIVVAAVSAGGYRSAQPLYMTETGISVDAPLKYITYYLVLALILLPSYLAGRRGFCHYFCWMSPFMILGRKTRNVLHVPALHLTAQIEDCRNCKQCTFDCPMSLDVNAMVQAGRMENTECILCGSCVDVCSSNVIHYAFDNRDTRRAAPAAG
jgi:polyferredoxin